MAIDRKKIISHKINIDKYIQKLNSFMTTVVNKTALLSLDETQVFQSQLKSLPQREKKSFEIPFEEKNSERFKKYIMKLEHANPSSISIWVDGTADCGVLKVSGLSKIRWDFPFDCDPAGILVLTTNDFEDELLFDWSEDQSGEQMLEVEVTGKNWSKVSYG